MQELVQELGRERVLVQGQQQVLVQGRQQEVRVLVQEVRVLVQVEQQPSWQHQLRP